MKWIFRRLVRLYPESMRRDFGEEMVEVLLARYRELRERGRLSAVRGFWLPEARALLRARRSEQPASGTGRGSLWSDIKLSLRGLAASPGFSGLATLLLGASVGLSAAVFSVTEAVLLSPLPFQNPHELVLGFETNDERGWTQAQVAPANFLDWHARATKLRSLTAHNDFLSELVLELDGEPARIRASRVYGNFFDVLGASLLAGRGFLEEETWEGADGVAVLSAALWRSQFGADPSAVGRSITIEGKRHRVVGIAAPSLRFPFEDVDLWIPLGWSAASRDEASFRRAHSLRVVGRLAEGARPEEASEELSRIAFDLSLDYPATNRDMGAGATPLHAWLVGDIRSSLLLLNASVLLVLLVACANVSSLFLVRLNRREREMSLRKALGAGSLALARLAFVESSMIAAAGGGIGLLIAWWGVPVLAAMAPPQVPGLDGVGVQPAVLVFGLALTGTTALLAGLLPALKVSSGRVASSAASGGERSTSRTGGFLVAAEMALAVLLATVALLLARSFQNARQVEPGFDLEGVTTATLRLPAHRYATPEDAIRLSQGLLERVRAEPGVEAATLAGREVLNPGWSSDFTAEGWSSEEYGVGVRHRQIAPGYLQTLRVPLLAGRAFSDDDVLGSPPVVLINESLAETFFPGESPIGRRICYDRVPDSTSYWRTIVGVVGNERHAGLLTPAVPTFIEPMLQGEIGRTLFLHVRSRARGETHAWLRALVGELDPAIPLYDVEHGEAVLGASLARERFLLTLMSLFAASGLFLSMAGVYSLLSFTVSRRTREIGVRMALGAPARSIVGLVLGRGLAVAVAGTAAGLTAGVLTGRLIGALLYDVNPSDPETLALVVSLVLAAAALASTAPALRAARVDPAKSIRTE